MRRAEIGNVGGGGGGVFVPVEQFDGGEDVVGEIAGGEAAGGGVAAGFGFILLLFAPFGEGELFFAGGGAAGGAVDDAGFGDVGVDDGFEGEVVLGEFGVGAVCPSGSLKKTCIPPEPVRARRVRGTEPCLASRSENPRNPSSMTTPFSSFFVSRSMTMRLRTWPVWIAQLEEG